MFTIIIKKSIALSNHFELPFVRINGGRYPQTTKNPPFYYNGTRGYCEKYSIRDLLKMLTDQIIINDHEFLLVTSHARKKLIKRNITEDQVREVYLHPDATYPQYDKPGRMNYQKEFGNGKIAKIGVQYNGDKPKILVTAFWIKKPGEE